jgi:hypothetical protein
MFFNMIFFIKRGYQIQSMQYLCIVSKGFYTMIIMVSLTSKPDREIIIIGIHHGSLLQSEQYID